MDSARFINDEQAVVITTQPTSSTAGMDHHNNVACSDNTPLLDGPLNPSYQNTCCCFGCFECLYKCCCCRIDCVSDLSLAEAISRYEEEFLLPVSSFTERLSNNVYLVKILEILYKELPDYFFTYLPTGSLREGFGKHIPSTSILASDYDIMLVPDAVTVGNADEVYSEGQSVVFVAINKLKKDGYLWLKLQDNYLDQWEKLCIRRHVIDEGCSLLSARKLRDVIRNTIQESTDLKDITKKYFTGITEDDIKVAISNNGPALTVEVSSIYHYAWNRQEETKYFYADFTFGLHCLRWPEEAKGFFTSPYRKSWPSSKTMELIKRMGCHVVPKSSTEALVKLTMNQEENTTFGTAPGLEWRYSFSQPEILLSTEIPAPAKTAFLAFKAFVKRHCNSTDRKICSYVLKCILYIVVETKPRAYWGGSVQVEKLLLEMMSKLESQLQQHYSPNYWIPSINLFDKLCPDDYAKLLKPIQKAKEHPQKYIADNFLEHMRCFRKCCCYCGKRYVMPSEEKVKKKKKCKYCYCCGCCCGSGCCDWPCAEGYKVDPLALDIY